MNRCFVLHGSPPMTLPVLALNSARSLNTFDRRCWVRPSQPKTCGFLTLLAVISQYYLSGFRAGWKDLCAAASETNEQAGFRAEKRCRELRNGVGEGERGGDLKWVWPKRGLFGLRAGAWSVSYSLPDQFMVIIGCVLNFITVPAAYCGQKNWHAFSL